MSSIKNVFLMKESKNLTPEQKITLDVWPWGFGDEDVPENLDQLMQSRGFLEVPGQFFSLYYNPKHWKLVHKAPRQDALNVSHYDRSFLIPLTHLADKTVEVFSLFPEDGDDSESAFDDTYDDETGEEKEDVVDMFFPHYNNLFYSRDYEHAIQAGFDPSAITDQQARRDWLGLDAKEINLDSWDSRNIFNSDDDDEAN